MRNIKSEAMNIVSLRNATYEAREKNNIGLFNKGVAVDITIYADEKEIESIGDLDNFITGICDGL